MLNSHAFFHDESSANILNIDVYPAFSFQKVNKFLLDKGHPVQADTGLFVYARDYSSLWLIRNIW